MPASGYGEFRLRREHHGVPTGRLAEHGRNARDGTRPDDARRRWHLPPGRLMVSRHRRRLHLDGAVVRTVVRSNRQRSREVSHLQKLGPPSSGKRAVMNLEIDRKRLCAEIDDLAAISDGEPPAVTRIVFTSTDLKARAWLKARCEGAGLSVRQDAIGNIFARWTGPEASGPAVGTGSHIDAIPNAGKYDGVVGVLGGLEAIRALQRSRFRPKHPIELLMFTSEEPTRFGIGCLGSRLLSGSLSPDAARELADKDGAPLEEVRRTAGVQGELEELKLPSGYYKAFVELHIEQGPLLERQQVPLGIVSNIAAPASLRISIEGAGAERILPIENKARASGAVDTVATVGMCDVFPGAINSIPSQVRLSVDVRDTNLGRRDEVMQAIDTACHTL